MLHPVLLCGGAGTRLWPLSRQALPKQFLPLLSQLSLLQETLKRGASLSDAQNPIVVCNNDHRFLVADQLQQIKLQPQAILLEPFGRNTAPAVALAAFCAIQDDPDAQILVLPSDHAIQNLGAFGEAVARAQSLATAGFLVTFGIIPNRPETGYGYIQSGEPLENDSFQIARFVEKPDAPTAERFLKAGGFFWNSGMFLFNAAQFLGELQKHAPEVFASAKTAWEEAARDLDFTRIAPETFAKSPSISLDYAVMEKTERAAVVPVEMGWSDIGAYDALWEISSQDENGNAGRGEVHFLQSQNCFAHSEKQMLYLLDVENLVAVATPDAILVANKDRAQDVKLVVEDLKKQGRAEFETHKKVFRPWGSYEGVERGDRFQVKQLIVSPGQKSSMQIHHHRSEHWIIVKGTAQVSLGEENHLLTEDQSIYIPLGVPHRIYNPGRIPLHFIEVQTGSYLEEDDIVRIDDEYGRG